MAFNVTFTTHQNWNRDTKFTVSLIEYKLPECIHWKSSKEVNQER